MNKTLILTLAVCAGFFGHTSAQADLTLVQEGKSDYQIILPNQPAPAEVTAARELQKYIKQVSNVTLPIAEPSAAGTHSIFIGQTAQIASDLGGLNFDTLRRDEIILKTLGSNLYLTGDAPRGTLYAVYELLEKELGIRFWSYDAETIPQTSSITLPEMDIRYAPTLFCRDAYYDIIRANPAFAAKRRNNGQVIILPPEWGGSVVIDGWCHTFERYLPSKVYYEKHPEWYAERDGKRLSGYVQLCLTNPEMRETLKNVILEHLRANPGIQILDLSQNDNQSFCQCERCSAFVKEHGNQSDLLMDLVNYIGEAVEPEFPDLLIETLAYQYTRQVPQSIFPRKNILIRLCSIECDFSQPLDSESNRAFADDIRSWSKIAPLLYVWNYVTNFSKYYLPHPNWKSLADDIRFLLAHNTRGLFEQGSMGPGKTADLPEYRAYLLTKLMWNPEQDAEQITSEFLNGFYGPAAGEILRYIEITSGSIAENPYYLRCYQTTTLNWLSEENLFAAWKALEQAKVKTADLPEYKKRVEFAALPITFALLERPESFLKLQPNNSEEIKLLIDKTLTTAREAGLQIYNEPGEKEDAVRSRLHRLYGIFDRIGTHPSVLPKEAQWCDIPTVETRLHLPNRCVFIEESASSASGKIIRMPNTHTEWAIQLGDLPYGKWQLYVELRCENPVETPAATVGIYSNTEKRNIPITLTGKEIAGSENSFIKIFEGTFPPNSYAYIAPCNNREAGNLYIDRFILVKLPEKSEK